MRILVTGSTGFIGSRLVQALKKQHTVFEMVRYAAGRYNYYRDPQVLVGDLHDGVSVKQAVKAADPEVIFHLAAQSAVSYSFSSPQDVMQVNLNGTIALVDAARELKNLLLFVHASTSEVYGNQKDFPIKETASLGATSPYAASKIAAEEYIRVAMDSYGFPALIIRPFNSYGRALVNNSHFVVERAITQALTEHKISLHNPDPYRDFMFREDHVAGYLAVLSAAQELADIPHAASINFSTGKSYTIGMMAEIVALDVETRVLKIPIPVDFKRVPDRPHDIQKLEGDNSSARSSLRWEPKYDLVMGIRQAVDEWTRTLGLST